MVMLVIFIFLACFSSTQGQVEEGFANFVEATMTNYSAWVAQESLDPTPPLVRTFNLTLINQLFTLQGKLSNVSVLGMSSPMVSYFPTDTSFSGNKIGFDYWFPSGGLEGKYNAIGSVLGGTYPISGSGEWNITSSGFGFRFDEKFDINDGHIVLRDANYSTTVGEFRFLGNIRGGFQNLFTPDTAPYEVQIIQEIASKLPTEVFGYSRANVLLIYRHIFNYLQSVFQSVPVEDIINWPAPTTMTP